MAESTTPPSKQPGFDLEQELTKLPLFTNLKPRRLLVEEGRLRQRPAGHAFVRQGDYAGTFCVILEGLASAVRDEPGGGSVGLGTMGPGQWFGEMSALSDQPAIATVRADTR